MSVLCIDKRGGTTTVELVDFVAGTKETLSRRTSGRNAGAPQLSRANGIIGTEADLKRQMKIDAELGVPVRYVKTHESYGPSGQKNCAWQAEFKGRGHKNQWLRRHKRYDADAGYGDPMPGDFRGSVPPEFQSGG